MSPLDRYAVLPVGVLATLDRAGVLKDRHALQVFLGAHTSSARRSLSGVVNGLGPGGFADSLFMSQAEMMRGARVLEAAGLLMVDWPNRIVYCRGAILFDPPSAPSAVKAAGKQFRELPDSPVRAAIRADVEAALAMQKPGPEKTAGGRPRVPLLAEWLRTINGESADDEYAPDASSEASSKSVSEDVSKTVSKTASTDSDPKPEPKTKARSTERPEGHEERHHAACGPGLKWCVHVRVESKLLAKLAPVKGGVEAARQLLREWYPTVWVSLPADTIIGDDFQFWCGRFNQDWSTDRATPSARPNEPRSNVPGVEQTRREYLMGRD